jgi:hypothetical protein
MELVTGFLERRATYSLDFISFTDALVCPHPFAQQRMRPRSSTLSLRSSNAKALDYDAGLDSLCSSRLNAQGCLDTRYGGTQLEGEQYGHNTRPESIQACAAKALRCSRSARVSRYSFASAILINCALNPLFFTNASISSNSTSR